MLKFKNGVVRQQLPVCLIGELKSSSLANRHTVKVARKSRGKRKKMGDEGDDDYMGDLSRFIQSDPHPKSSHSHHLPRKSSSQMPVSNSRSGFLSSSNKKAKTLNWQEQRKVKREQKQIEEDQQTIENIEKAIPQSNIGFKLLKQMGYSPGSALGKDGSGRAEPVRLEIRRGRAGIGKEDPRVEKERREKEKFESEKINQEELMADFGNRQKERWKGRRIVVNFRKAEAALVQLENREVVEEKEDKDAEEKEEEEEEEEITVEDLHAVLMKLRDEHLYCLFCGCQYESKDTLLSSCPGIDEDDH